MSDSRCSEACGVEELERFPAGRGPILHSRQDSQSWPPTQPGRCPQHPDGRGAGASLRLRTLNLHVNHAAIRQTQSEMEDRLLTRRDEHHV